MDYWHRGSHDATLLPLGSDVNRTRLLVVPPVAGPAAWLRARRAGRRLRANSQAVVPCQIGCSQRAPTGGAVGREAISVHCVIIRVAPHRIPSFRVPRNFSPDVGF
jgi:hypothetical protein